MKILFNNFLTFYKKERKLIKTKEFEEIFVSNMMLFFFIISVGSLLYIFCIPIFTWLWEAKFQIIGFLLTISAYLGSMYLITKIQINKKHKQSNKQSVV